MARKYELPEFLSGIVSRLIYERWLFAKADAHFRRDRRRGNTSITREEYKIAIHKAVLGCGGFDDYTGEQLDWPSICQYDNTKSSIDGRRYKASLALLPTVDHVGDGLGKADFKICGWRTNGSKADMTHEEFVALCRRVLARIDGQGTASSTYL